MTTDKRFWMRIAAGTVAIIAIASGCGDRKTTGCENAEVVAALDRIEAGVDGLREDTKYIKEDTKEIKDLIETHDKTVNEKLDTLKAHCDKQKSCDCKPVKKAPVKKPGAVKPAPVKPAPAKPAPVKPVEPAVEEPKVAVEVVSGENKVVVPVDAVKPNQAVIVNGDNSGTIIVNANGIVNGNAIVNGSNNTVVNGDNNKVNVDKVAEARKKYVEACAQKKVVVLNERVQCYTK